MHSCIPKPSCVIFLFVGIPRALSDRLLSIRKISTHPTASIQILLPPRRLPDPQFWGDCSTITSTSYTMALCFVQTAYLISINTMGIVIIPALFVLVPRTLFYAMQDKCSTNMGRIKIFHYNAIYNSKRLKLMYIFKDKNMVIHIMAHGHDEVLCNNWKSMFWSTLMTRDFMKNVG